MDFAPFLSINHGERGSIGAQMYIFTCFVTAIDFREAIGGEEKIRDYCHSLAIKGGATMARVLNTRVMENDEKELTANMVSSYRTTPVL